MCDCRDPVDNRESTTAHNATFSVRDFMSWSREVGDRSLDCLSMKVEKAFIFVKQYDVSRRVMCSLFNNSIAKKLSISVVRFITPHKQINAVHHCIQIGQ